MNFQEKYLPLISYVIPAHNAEGVLKRCIESIVEDANQSMISYEIIVVENASSDDTYSIAECMCRTNSNITLLKSEKGVSIARNIGMKSAKGKKIVFVDADDLWLRGAIKKITEDTINRDTDLIVYSYLKDDATIMHSYNYMNHVITGCNIDDCRAWLISRPTLRMQAWAKVFDKRLIDHYGLFFDENLSYAEDSEFVIRYSQKCNSIFVSDTIIYRYCSDTTSAMRSTNRTRTDEYLKSLRTSREYMKDEQEIVKKAFWEYILIHFNIICVHDIFDVNIKESFWKKAKIMKQLIKHDIFEEALNATPLKNCLTLQLIPEALIKCHLVTLGGVVCYVKVLLNYRKCKQITVGVIDSNRLQC